MNLKDAIVSFLENPPADFELALNAGDVACVVELIAIACPPAIIDLLKAQNHPMVGTVKKIYTAIAQSQGTVSPEVAAQVPAGAQRVDVALVVNDYIDADELAKVLEQACSKECDRQRQARDPDRDQRRPRRWN